MYTIYIIMNPQEEIQSNLISEDPVYKSRRALERISDWHELHDQK